MHVLIKGSNYLADMPATRWADIGGQTHGMLTAIEPLGVKTPGPTGQHLWLCRCDCGNYKVVPVGSWTGKGTRSCGCIQGRPVRHGMTGTSIHNRWMNMIKRCTNTTYAGYPRWGGRGIKVCERWMTFENFYADMGDVPFPDAELDREDNDGHYEPGNVRWLAKVDHTRKTKADTLKRKSNDPS